MKVRLGQILNQEDLTPKKLNEIFGDIVRAFEFAPDTKWGDTVYLTQANTVTGDNTYTGKIIMSGNAIDHAVHTETAHATTADIWTGGNTCILSGSAVTFTAIANAPNVGAVRIVIANATHTITDGATFEVDGNANYTCRVGDVLRFEAKTVSTFRVNIISTGDGLAPIAGAAPSSATESAEGLVELATDAETATGTDTVRATTPANIASVLPSTATTSAEGLVELATSTENVTGTDAVRPITPAIQGAHFSAAKCIAKFGVTGNILGDSLNITSVTDTGTGIATVTIATDFDSADYVAVLTLLSTIDRYPVTVSQAAGSIECRSYRETITLTDPTAYYFAAYGTQV